MPGFYFYFPPNGIRFIELIFIESETAIFLRVKGNWVEHSYPKEVLDNLPELVIVKEDVSAAFDLVALAERENRAINSSELRPFVKLF